MNCVTIDLYKLKDNLKVIKGWMDGHPSSWTVVTKVLCGHSDTLRALQLLGIRSMGDSRLSNLEAIDKIVPDFESWYLRVSDLSSIKKVVALSDVSLNSEIEVIESLNDEAKKLNEIHQIIIMIELGDLREGVLPGSLVRFYKTVFELSNIKTLGIGANIGCMAGLIPSIEQFTQLALYKELLELKFKRKLPMISAGSSSVLPMLLEGKLPKSVNHFRIGEAIFLGTDLINEGTLPGLHDDVVVLEAEIAEVKEKGLVSQSETGTVAPFESSINEELSPGQRGYRALISVGQLDTDINGLIPINPRHQIAGASSDITAVNLGDDAGGLCVGDSIKFKLNYSAMLRLMSGKYIAKRITPSLEEFEDTSKNEQFEVEPAIGTTHERESE
ncbi:MAG: alanine racemase [candidate division Zixibacteria bacterium]|nr:alanine racemase [candidate division Zixibacteria bacterium]